MYSLSLLRGPAISYDTGGDGLASRKTSKHVGFGTAPTRPSSSPVALSTAAAVPRRHSRK